MIVITDYKPTWSQEFESLRLSLTALLGALAVRIDHIGSTAVSGLSAKDIIDIQVTVHELNPQIIQKLTDAKYRYWENITHDHVPLGADNNAKLWEKFFFTEPKGQRRTNVHIRIHSHPNQSYALLFRDYLRTHPNCTRTIELIKREIVKRHADDVTAYYDIKDPVYDLIWNAALDWAKQTNWKI